MRSQLVPVARLPDDTLEPALFWWLNNQCEPNRYRSHHPAQVGARSWWR